MAKDKELELAKMLVNAQRDKFDASKPKDKFKERVLEVIEKRSLTAGLGAEGAAPQATPPAADLMDALRKSLVL